MPPTSSLIWHHLTGKVGHGMADQGAPSMSVTMKLVAAELGV
jgi:hypothetical protein